MPNNTDIQNHWADASSWGSTIKRESQTRKQYYEKKKILNCQTLQIVRGSFSKVTLFEMVSRPGDILFSRVILLFSPSSVELNIVLGRLRHSLNTYVAVPGLALVTAPLFPLYQLFEPEL